MLAGLALLLFVLGEHQHAAIGFDSRFVLFAKEMLRNGPSFFRPRITSRMPITAQPRPSSYGCCPCLLVR